MTEQEVRALVRDVIAKHAAGPSTLAVVGGALPVSAVPSRAQWRDHVSHGRFVLPDGADADGPCIIEPAVACNHCGYCKSYGH
jgi:hypothetical protein